LEAGTVAMLEPTIITPDGLFGIFFGRTYVLTDGGNEKVTKFPHELIVI
jgi:Xaa-Pro aminopeptidase